MDQGSTCRVCHGPLRGPSVDGVCADCLRTPPSEPVTAATATTRSFDTPLPTEQALTRTAPPQLVPAPRPAFEEAVREYLRAKHYRNPKKVAAGGYGTVYEATNSVGRRVAVKVLHPHLASELIKSRFETEAKALAGLDHPGLVQFYHYEPDADAPFLVTEFVPGGTLAQSVKEGGPLPPTEAARLLAEVAAVVQYLHDREVLHRDLKPSNILLDATGRPKVADFGLAKRLGEADKQTRSVNSVGGTPEYCAPEQFRPGAKTDARSDVYALGATLYAVLTGNPPFARGPDDDHCQKLVKIIDTRPPPPLPADVPANLARVCLKCLEKHPDDRYRSAAEVAAKLGRIAQGLPEDERPVREWVARRWRAAKRAPLGKKVTAAVVALLAVAALAAAVFYRPAPPPPPPPPEPDPNDIAAQVLQAGGTIDLIENGWPRFQKKIFGQERLMAVFDANKKRHVAAVTEGNYALILLTQNPGVDRYRLTVQLRQDKTAQGPNKPNAVVGVTLDYQARTVIANKVQHSFTLVGFNDYDPGEKMEQWRVQVTEQSLLGDQLEGALSPLRSGGASVLLRPYLEADRPVRTLVLDVTPNEVTARVDNGFGRAVYERADMEKTRTAVDEEKIRPALERPHPGAALNLDPRRWNPRGPIGVYVRHSTLTVHSFEIGPIPPE